MNIAKLYDNENEKNGAAKFLQDHCFSFNYLLFEEVMVRFCPPPTTKNFENNSLKTLDYPN